MIAPSMPAFFTACQSIVFCHADTSITPFACWANRLLRASKNACVPLYVPQCAPYSLFCNAASFTDALAARVFEETAFTSPPFAATFSFTSAALTGMNDSPSVFANGSGCLLSVPTIFGSVTVSPVSMSFNSPSGVAAYCSDTTVASSEISADTLSGSSASGLSGIASAAVSSATVTPFATGRVAEVADRACERASEEVPSDAAAEAVTEAADRTPDASASAFTSASALAGVTHTAPNIAIAATDAIAAVTPRTAPDAVARARNARSMPVVSIASEPSNRFFSTMRNSLTHPSRAPAHRHAFRWSTGLSHAGTGRRKQA